jgi:hypothetical protein
MKTTNRQHVQPDDLFLYAHSFHEAAKALAASFRPNPAALVPTEAFPVVFMYRHAIELNLKSIVLGGGSNFLETKPDRISVSKSHSISWLAQFVCQIIIKLKWEDDFKCEGIDTLADFKKQLRK